MNMGPRLAYNFEAVLPTIYEILNRLIIEAKPNKYYVLLVFGEIDIRTHLVKYENVRECVERYMRGIIDLQKKGHDVIVFGAIGNTIREDNDPRHWGEFPVYGTCQERNVIAKEFDSYLEKLCKKNNVKFFSIFDKLVDENNTTLDKYYKDDKIHLSDPAKSLVEPLLLDLL